MNRSDPVTPRCDLYNEDCISGMERRLGPSTVDLVVTSIPFEELSRRPAAQPPRGDSDQFTYSGKPEDVGNNGSTVDVRAGRFALNMRFVVAALERVMKPGTNCCVHIQQLLAYKVQHGFMGRRDFRGAMVDVFGAGGLRFVGECVVPKNPQAMAQKLNLHSLQFKTGVSRDGSLLAPAVNDYVLIFRKDGQHPCPPKPLYDRRKNPGGWVTTDEWVRWASGVWADVMEIDVLDGCRLHKEAKHEKHVCPLQLEVIRRCVALYTNPASVQPDVTVLDPFMGIGSTAYVALGGKSPATGLRLADPRNVLGFELKESYYKAAVDNAAKAREQSRRAAADLLTAAGV